MEYIAKAKKKKKRKSSVNSSFPTDPFPQSTFYYFKPPEQLLHKLDRGRCCQSVSFLSKHTKELQLARHIYI